MSDIKTENIYSLGFRDIREGMTLRGLILRSSVCIQPASISAELPECRKGKKEIAIP
jgi:hypothetical protein